MEYVKTVFTGHAIRRMFERKISKPEVLETLAYGEVIADYPDDVPFPSYLMLHFIGGRPIHIVAAMDSDSKTAYIVTAYDPEPAIWDDNFKKRR